MNKLVDQEYIKTTTEAKAIHQASLESRYETLRQENKEKYSELEKLKKELALMK